VVAKRWRITCPAEATVIKIHPRVDFQTGEIGDRGGFGLTFRGATDFLVVVRLAFLVDDGDDEESTLLSN
jgi:hypothetical protein